jgi:hypothetical protein
MSARRRPGAVPRVRPPVKRVVTEAACSTPNLTAFGTSLALAFVAGNVWVALLGVWLYVLLIARDSTSGPLWRRIAERDAEAARQLPATSSLTVPSVMLLVEALQKGFDGMARVMRETPDSVKPHLVGVVASLDQLRGQAAQLIREADALSAYLLHAPAEATETAIDRLSLDLARASDAGVRAEYERALTVRQEQLAAIAEVTHEQERILAAIQLIIGTVEAFPAWAYRLRVLDGRAKGDRIGDLHDELVELKTELDSSQLLLEGIVGPS